MHKYEQVSLELTPSSVIHHLGALNPIRNIISTLGSVEQQKLVVGHKIIHVGVGKREAIVCLIVKVGQVKLFLYIVNTVGIILKLIKTIQVSVVLAKYVINLIFGGFLPF